MAVKGGGSEADHDFADGYRPRYELARRLAYDRTGDVTVAKEIATDVMSDLWIAWRKVQRRHSNVEAWITTVTKRKVINRWRRDLRDRTRGQELVATALVRSQGSRVPTDGVDDKFDVLHLLGRLRSEDREMVWLYFAEGYSISELSAKMGASNEAVTKRIQRAIERLRRLMLGGA